MTQPRQRKVRSDAGLKNLPAELQRELADLLNGGRKLADGIAWLKDHGHKAAASTVSEWLAWWNACDAARRREMKVDAWLADERKLHPEMTDAALFERGQRLFSLMAIAEEDAKAWVNVQRTTMEKNRGAFDREKFEADHKAELQRLEMARQELQLKLDKRNDEVAERKAAMQAALNKAKSRGGVRPETIEKIEKELKLL